MKYEIQIKHVAGPWFSEAAAESKNTAHEIVDLLEAKNPGQKVRCIETVVIFDDKAENGWSKGHKIVSFGQEDPLDP